MPGKPTNDPIVRRFKAALEKIYGNRIERVVLFGSHARGEERQDSDYDVAVFLKTLPDKWKELHRLADLRVEFLDEDDPRTDHDLRRFLAQSYDFKSVADYFTGPDATTSVEEATNAVETSKQSPCLPP